MVIPQPRQAYPKSRRWNKSRVQFGGALAFAVILPAVILSAFYPFFFNAQPTRWTLAANLLASCFSVYLVRNLSLYPGIRGAFFSLPAVLASYALTFSCFLLLRIDYSRALLIGGAAATLGWLYVSQFMAARGPAVRVGVVPFGNVVILQRLKHLDLHVMATPAIGVHLDILVADFGADLPDEWEAFLADCAIAGLPVLHVKQLHESLTGQVNIEHLSENSFGSLVPFLGYLRLRRVVDRVVALVIGMLILPLLPIVALLIKLDSRGPVLFRQTRIGYRGEPFRIAKFRTMVITQETKDPRQDAFTRDGDPRITRLGRHLRRLRIDEIPQILNILAGEMSWIGPRPEAAALSHWYEQELPFYRYRHIVPPGITGWAQVNQGHVFELDQVDDKLRYDFYYIKAFSPLLDALIVAKTIQIIVTGFGSR